MNIRTTKVKAGDIVVITEVAFTKGKIGELAYFDKKAKKWVIYFDGGWQGWYKKEEFKILN